MKLLTFIFTLVACTTQVCSQERITHPKVANKRCFESSHYRSCYELAQLYYLAHKEQEALHYAQIGCEIELKESCSKEKAFERMKYIMKKKKQWDKTVNDSIRENPHLINIPQQILKREKKCFSKENIDDCAAVGAHFQFLQSPTDIKRAIKAYKFGCTHKHERSCSSLELIKKGIGKVYVIDM